MARVSRPTDRRSCRRSQVVGPADHLPGLAGRRRPRAAAPARHRAAGERRRRALDDGRLYEGNRAVRLAQYGLLGIGGARVLDALGIEPAVIHLNEGHPALAPLELATQRVERGASVEDALAVGARADASSRRTRRCRPATRRTRRPSSWTPSATSPTGSASTTRSSSASAASTPATATSRPG